MKKFIWGLIIDSLLTGSTTALAKPIVSYYLTQSTTSIFINNVKYSDTTLPVMNYNGNTYVPLKNFGKLCQKTVTWDKANRQINIGQPCAYLDESEYTGDELQMVKQINLAIKYFNEHNRTAFDNLFTVKEGGNYNVWADYQAIAALGYINFNSINKNDASVTVWHATIFNENPEKIQENCTDFSFTKTGSSWQLVMID